MENIQIIIRVGNVETVNKTRQTIEEGVPEKIGQLFVSHNSDAVIRKARDTKDCIVIMGYSPHSSMSVHGLDAKSIKSVNKTAKIYHYSLVGISAEYEDLFDGHVVGFADCLIEFIKSKLEG